MRIALLLAVTACSGSGAPAGSSRAATGELLLVNLQKASVFPPR